MASRTGGRKGKALLGAAIALSTVPIAIEHAEAYPEKFLCFPGNPKNGWTFATTGWTASLKGKAANGIRGWDEIDDRQGNPIHPLTEGSSLPVDLRWGLGHPSFYAWIGSEPHYDNPLDSCQDLITFNSARIGEFNDVNNFMSTVAAHEMGHHLNLGHTGWHDTSENNNQHHAIMSTKLGSVSASASRSFAKDDYGQATHRDRYTVGGYRVATPNFGFENGSDHWGFGSGGASLITSADSYSGSRHLRWKPSSVNSEVWQTTNITPCHNNAHMTLVASGQFKKVNAADVKHIAITLRTRNVDYGGLASAADTWDCSEMNQNNEARGPIIQRCQSMATPTTNWLPFNSFDSPSGEPWSCPFVFNHTPDREGVDAIVVAQSAVQTPGGALQTVTIDELRVGVIS